MIGLGLWRSLGRHGARSLLSIFSCGPEKPGNMVLKWEMAHVEYTFGFWVGGHWGLGAKSDTLPFLDNKP